MGMGSEQAFQGDTPPTSPGDDWASCARSAMAVVTSSLSQAPFGQAIEGITQCRAQLDSLESLLLAQRAEAGHSDRSNENTFTRTGGVSKGEAKRRTRRANAVRKNPKLAKKLAAGKLSTEQIDRIAEASEKTDGAAANDEELIDEISKTNPDQGKSIVRKYIEDSQGQGDRDNRYRRQRKNRKVTKTKTMSGMSRLILDGDDETIEMMLQRFERGADALYRSDGGRDVPNGEHRRTRDQRMFDAAVQGLTGNGDPDPDDDTASVDVAPAGDSESADAAPANDGAPSNDDASAKSSRPTEPPDRSPSQPRPPRNRPGERPTMVFRVDLDNLGKANDVSPETVDTWKTELIGTGLVPTSLADYFGCISDLAVQLVSGKGAVLWHGRSRRTVTIDQWVALVARDSGCVQCGAHHTRCEAHHLTPWTAPLRGETNVEDMALMCVDCHHRLHELNQTLFQDAEGHWRTRAATAAETPVRGPTHRTRRNGERGSARSQTERAGPRKRSAHSGGRPTANSSPRAP